MARIETGKFYHVSEVAEKFNRTESTIMAWIKYGDFDKNDILVYQGETYILKEAVDTFKKRLIY